MNPRKSGRKGGLKTKETHFTLCPCCGQPVKSQFYKETGRHGGQATLRKYGKKFYTNMGKMGGRGNTREKRRGSNSESSTP